MRASWFAVVIVIGTLFTARAAFACRGCKEPTLAELAHQAASVFAGKVASAKHEHSVIAVSDVWKGSVAKTVERVGCWQLFEKVGAKVIVLVPPQRGWSTPFVSECLGVFADTPATRATLRNLLGSPAAP